MKRYTCINMAVKEIYDGAKDLVSCLEDGRAYFWSKENKLCYYNLEKVKEVSMNEVRFSMRM